MDHPSRPFFSVLVTTFNRPALLGEALGSLRNQTFEDFEWIVVNDGRTPVELRDDPRFILIDKGTGEGMAAALNTGHERARSLRDIPGRRRRLHTSSVGVLSTSAS